MSDKRREALEAEFLRLLMMRDAAIYAERTIAADSIVSHSQVKRTNPQITKAPRPAPSIFEDAYSLGQLS